MNILETGLAFLEGLALIASPCILPVLPLVLSASADGGRRRPFGIILGFVVSFSLFAFASRKAVTALGVDLDVLKDISLALLFAFGAVLLSSKLSEKFSGWTQGLARVGTIAAAGDGFISGIGIGALIGLVWTPCAGPILAAVLVQVIRQQTDLAGYLVILSFALGAGVPMLIISLAGRQIARRLGAVSAHAETMRKAFGIVIIASVLFIASGADIAALLPQETGMARNATQLEHALEKPYPAPEFTGIESWLNTAPLTMQSLKGKVVLVDFWTYSCINCIRTLPHITDWDKKYRDKGLVIIGVHAPEFAFEKKRENVAAAIAAHGIRYPVALDNALSTWTAFDNKYWPAHYLIDQQGRVVYTHFGEGDYDVTENNIRFLLGLKDKAAAAATEVYNEGLTPETYLGRNRAARMTTGTPAQHQWAIDDSWDIEGEKIVAKAAGATLKLNFMAQKVFLVLGTTTGKPVHLSVTLDGHPAGAITVRAHELYQLIDKKTFGPGLLEIKTDAPGLEAYAFTFG